MTDLLHIENLSVQFDTDEGIVQAVSHIDLHLQAGQTLGLVGESGSGKSVTAMSILRLLPSPPARYAQGRIFFQDQDLLTLPTSALRSIRGNRISMIFQEPMTALSPLHRIGDQLTEILHFHRKLSKQAARAEALTWLQRAELPNAPACMNAWPRELSGGMRQRVMIAMALMLNPQLIIADEPTTALDVTIQAQILQLMRSLRTASNALLLITHDMGVIREMCTHVAVMYAGELVETGTINEIFNNPLHPYTRALLQSIPRLNSHTDRLPSLAGQVPSPLHYPAGCHFAERCPRAFNRCRTEHPATIERYGRTTRCHLYAP